MMWAKRWSWILLNNIARLTVDIHCHYHFAYCLTLNLQVERIFADRVSKADGDDLVPEYLVKWQGLPYAESTW